MENKEFENWTKCGQWASTECGQADVHRDQRIVMIKELVNPISLHIHFVPDSTVPTDKHFSNFPFFPFCSDIQMQVSQ